MSDESKYWKLNLIYVNPEDHRVFVKKRVGYGWSLNFARPTAVLLLLVVAGLIATAVITSLH